MPPAGELATSLATSQMVQVKEKSRAEQNIRLNDGSKIPQLGYGMYQIPADATGEQAILDAISAGYRHFDGASFYANEHTLGSAIRKCGISREEFFIATKVWTDALKLGREGVRKSVMDSLSKLDCGGYVDICYVHWPVPDHFIAAYHELEVLYSEGKIRSLGLSNFSPDEYEQLHQSGLTVPPVVNQLEVSPVFYRPDLIEYFQSRNIEVVAYKPLNRGGGFQSKPIEDLAEKYSVSPAQIMLRWCLQKGLIVICKTSNPSRMAENRSIMHFSLSKEDIIQLDLLTTDEDRRLGEEHELMSKRSL